MKAKWVLLVLPDFQQMLQVDREWGDTKKAAQLLKDESSGRLGQPQHWLSTSNELQTRPSAQDKKT